ncbi:MAG: phage late control D family protein [Candidatus Ornithomonoglobus sp.]
MSTVVTSPNGNSTVVTGGAVTFTDAPKRRISAEYPRMVEGLVGINGKNVWGDIKQYNTSLAYVDVASGATDSFDITMYDTDEHFINDWLIDKGTELNSKIKFCNWDFEGDTKYIDCGIFLVDSIEIRGFPFEVDIKSLALPVNGTKNTKKWENISVSAIAQDICDHLGVELLYYADNLTLESRQQSQQTDINFLFSLCNEYGFGMKVYKNKIAIFDRAAQDKATPVNPENPYMIKEIADSVTITDNTEGTYTGVKAIYKPKDKDDSIEYILGTTEKMIVLENAGQTRHEAEIKAAAALYNANIEAVKLKFTVKSYYPFYSGTNYYFYGLGGYSGAYGIEKVSHQLNENGGYSAKIEAHAIALEKDRKQSGG